MSLSESSPGGRGGPLPQSVPPKRQTSQRLTLTRKQRKQHELGDGSIGGELKDV